MDLRGVMEGHGGRGPLRKMRHASGMGRAASVRTSLVDMHWTYDFPTYESIWERVHGENSSIYWYIEWGVGKGPQCGMVLKSGLIEEEALHRGLHNITASVPSELDSTSVSLYYWAHLVHQVRSISSQLTMKSAGAAEVTQNSTSHPALEHPQPSPASPHAAPETAI